MLLIRKLKMVNQQNSVHNFSVYVGSNLSTAINPFFSYTGSPNSRWRFPFGDG